MENLETKSVAELEELKKAVETALEVARAREKDAVIEEMRALAESKGFSMDELFGKAKKDKSKKVLPVKFQDPSDSLNTWTGRGKKPKWLATYISAGRDLEEFKV